MSSIEICAWCPDSRERTAKATAKGMAVTHGICPACRDRVMGRRSPMTVKDQAVRAVARANDDAFAEVAELMGNYHARK